jgi:predicted GH43/DUF377 family glycosyl hydrolase
MSVNNNMRFQIYPCDDGRYFIVDTSDDEIMCYTGNQHLADRLATAMSESVESPDSELIVLDLTKTH